jgi:hypothetical protein
MICVKETDNVFIDAIAVDEQFRNQGIGSTMINGIRKRFTLPVTLETDDDAVEFYRKIGFSAEPFEKYGITRYRCTAPEIPKELKSFLDEKLRLTAYPTKLKTKEMALVYLAGKFERGITYSEKEINEILKAWHTFNDWAVLRRDLFELGFFDRKPDGTLYKLAKQEV